MMNDLVLTLAIRWLTTVDALAAVCVNKRWCHVLSIANDDEVSILWKQVFGNSHPLLEKEAPQDANFRALCTSLFKNEVPEPTVKIFRATLRPDQVFAIFELYRNKREANGKRRVIIEASWKCPLIKEGGIYWFETPLTVMRGANPYSEANQNNEKAREWKMRCQNGETNADDRFQLKLTPYDFALLDVLGSREARIASGENLFAKLTIFRRDTMQFVCVVNHAIEEDMRHFTSRNRYTYRSHFQGQGSLTFADNDLGNKAIAMLHNRQVRRIELRRCSMLHSTVLLPRRNADDVPPWLANCYRSLHADQTFRPSQEDEQALSRIPYFNFNVSLNFEIRRIQQENEIMVLLEGLCWK